MEFSFILKSDSNLPKKLFLFALIKATKNDKKYFNNLKPVEKNEKTLTFLFFPGETAWGVSERIVAHSGRENKLNLSKHDNERDHKSLDRQEFRIVGKEFRNCALKYKIAKGLFSRELEPSLNVQGKLIELKLFN